MKNVLKILAGVVLALLLVYFYAPKMMINKTESVYSFDETITKISENINKEGWILQGLKRLDKSVKKHGEKAFVKVALIEICHPKYASKIINDKESTHISVMMPCTISVYETENKEVYISTMNIKPMAWVFGGTVKDVMGGAVYEAQQKFISLQ